MNSEVEEVSDSASKQSDAARGKVSELAELSEPGRPSKYTPETVQALLAAVADGLTQKQACLASGIGESTLYDWRKERPDLEGKLIEAREQARQTALKAIKAAGDRDWKAHEAWLRLSFQADYRQPNTKIDVNTNAQAGTVVITDEKRKVGVGAASQPLIPKGEQSGFGCGFCPFLPSRRQ